MFFLKIHNICDLTVYFLKIKSVLNIILQIKTVRKLDEILYRKTTLIKKIGSLFCI